MDAKHGLRLLAINPVVFVRGFGLGVVFG